MSRAVSRADAAAWPAAAAPGRSMPVETVVHRSVDRMRLRLM